MRGRSRSLWLALPGSKANCNSSRVRKYRNAREVHQTLQDVIEVDVRENDRADFCGIAADEAHEFGERHFGI